MIMQEIIPQIAIPIFSGASIWAFAGKRHQLGFVLGLCGQPFWIYSSFTGGLWGVFIVSLWFTGNHIRGLINHHRIGG
jgi:hypothetical protein